MIEKRIRGGICHAINRYLEPNNKCMKMDVWMGNVSKTACKQL